MIKLRNLISLNALLFIALGIAFALYAPLMLAAFGTADLQEGESYLYWYVVSFARLFGVALFGYGFLLWAAREGVGDDKEDDRSNAPEMRRGILLALILADVVGMIVSLTQQVSIWITPAGWLLVGIFLLFLLGYGYFFSKSSVKGPESPQG